MWASRLELLPLVLSAVLTSPKAGLGFDSCWHCRLIFGNRNVWRRRCQGSNDDHGRRLGGGGAGGGGGVDWRRRGLSPGGRGGQVIGFVQHVLELLQCLEGWRGG